MIQIGDKVVCVPVASPNGIPLFDRTLYNITGPIPAKNQIYVIRGFYIDNHGRLGLRLEGSVIVDKAANIEIGWWIGAFKLLEPSDGIRKITFEL